MTTLLSVARALLRCPRWRWRVTEDGDGRVVAVRWCAGCGKVCGVYTRGAG